MNRQELFDGNIVNKQIELDTSYLPFIKSVHRSFSDVTYPRFFSGWPYFILILAALLMGSSSRLSSREIDSKDLVQSLEQTIAGAESIIHNKAQYFFGRIGEYPEPNRCEANSVELASAVSASSKKPWCAKEGNQKHSF